MGRRNRAKALLTNIQTDVTSSSGEEEYRRTLDIINRLSVKYLKHDRQEDDTTKDEEMKLQPTRGGHKRTGSNRCRRNVGNTVAHERDEACRYDGDDENNTGSASQSEDASMKSASDDLYDFEQSTECLRLELSPDGKPARNKLNDMNRPCRSTLTVSGSNRRNVATNERKGNRVRPGADKKRGVKKSPGRKRLHSSDENVDATRCRFKQRTSIRLASSSITKSDMSREDSGLVMSREDSGLVMSPPISMSLRSSRGRAVISTASLVSTSTPNNAVAMQTNSASSDDSCFGFKYLMPSVSLILSPVEASPSRRRMSVTPDDSGISLSLTQPCSVVMTPLPPHVPTAGKTPPEVGMFDKPVEKKPARRRTKKTKHGSGVTPDQLAAQMNAEFDDLDSYELSVEAN